MTSEPSAEPAPKQPDEDLTITVGVPRPTREAMRAVWGEWGAWPWARFLPYGTVLAGFGLLVLLVFCSDANGIWKLGAVALILGVLAVRSVVLLVVRRIGKAEWLKSPSAQRPNDWRIDWTGVTVADGTFTAAFRWGAFRNVREESDRFIFMLGPDRNMILPIQFMDAGARQVETLRRLIKAVRASGRLGAGVDYPPPSSDKA